MNKKIVEIARAYFGYDPKEGDALGPSWASWDPVALAIYIEDCQNEDKES